MSTLEERSLADSDDSDRFEFVGTSDHAYPDAISSFIASVQAHVLTLHALAAMTAERDKALAALARIQTLLGDHDGPLWAVRGVREADIRAALEGKAP